MGQTNGVIVGFHQNLVLNFHTTTTTQCVLECLCKDNNFWARLTLITSFWYQSWLSQTHCVFSWQPSCCSSMISCLPSSIFSGDFIEAHWVFNRKEDCFEYADFENLLQEKYLAVVWVVCWYNRLSAEANALFVFWKKM